MFENWPFTNFHDLNLDWIIKRIKNVEDSEAAAKASEEEAAASAKEAENYASAAADSAAQSASSASSAEISEYNITAAADEIAVMSAQISGLIANAGDTDGNSELLDIRIGYNGETFDTAGNAVRGQVSDIAENFTSLNWWYTGEWATNNFNGVTRPTIDKGLFILNGQNATNANIYSTNIFCPAGSYKFRLRRVSGTSSANLYNLDPKIRLKDINLTPYDTITPAKTANDAIAEFETTSAGYVQLICYLASSTVYTDYKLEIILVQSEVEPDFKYANYKSILSEAVRSTRGNVVYFAADGDDNAPGTVERPKKDPVSIIAEGEHIILLRSGDTFNTPLGITPGNDTYIGIYGGTVPAILECEYTNNSQFVTYDTNIYSVAVDTINIGYVEMDGVKYWNRVPALAMLEENKAFFIDTGTRTLYMYSDTNIAGKTPSYSRKINGCTISGKENIIVHDLKIRNAGAHGIRIDNSTNIIAERNEIEWCGGAYLTTNNPLGYGNGIEVWMEDCHDIRVKYNYVHDIFDTGITPQCGAQVNNTASNNIQIISNIIKRCQAGIEVYNTGTATRADNIGVYGNKISELADISGGYRRNSTVGQVPFANMYAQSMDTVYIENNVTVTPAEYAIYYMERAGNQYNRFIVQNNIFAVDGAMDNIGTASTEYEKADFTTLKSTGAYMGLLNK